MNIEDIIKSTISNAEEVPSAKETGRDFGEFMEGVLKDLLGDQVTFKEVKEVDDGKDDTHIDIKCKNVPDEVHDPFEAAELVFDKDDKDIILHATRTIAHKHRKELPTTATYNLLAAFLSRKSDECRLTSLKAFKQAQEASERKARANVMSKFNDFTQSLSDEESEALDELLSNIK